MSLHLCATYVGLLFLDILHIEDGEIIKALKGYFTPIILKQITDFGVKSRSLNSEMNGFHYIAQ